jgi:hypothetical protein
MVMLYCNKGHLQNPETRLTHIDALSFAKSFEEGTWGSEKTWVGGSLLLCFIAF